MQVTINMDTEKETAEDLIKLQKALDELIGKKLGAVSKHSQPEPLQTINPEPEPVVESTGFPTQPEEAPGINATSPHEVGEQVREQQASYSEPVQEQQASYSEPVQEQPRGIPDPVQEQPRGWPAQPQEEEKKKEEKEKEVELDDINDAMSKLYSGGN